jgi:hypothetical protein
MPKKVLLTTTFLLFLLININVNAQTVIAKYAGEFMALGVGGRPSGMGGAFTALANDVTAGYYNPAGLAYLNYPQISLMHSEQFGSLVNYDYAAVAIPFGKDLTFSVSGIRLAVEGIPDTRNAITDVNGDGVADINDVNNPNFRPQTDLITFFSNQDYAFYFSFAKRESDNFSYGGNIKIIRRDIGDAGATGIGLDVAALYSPFQDFFVGANLQDVTTTLVAWSTGRNELITPTLKLGAAYGIDFLGGKLSPALDFDIRFENRRFASQFNIGPVSFDAHSGLEFNYKNIFAIRGGYSDVKQFTIGAGVKLPKLNIDYSFARFNASSLDRLEDTHRISLILTLEEPKFLREGI